MLTDEDRVSPLADNRPADWPFNFLNSFKCCDYPGTHKKLYKFMRLSALHVIRNEHRSKIASAVNNQPPAFPKNWPIQHFVSWGRNSGLFATISSEWGNTSTQPSETNSETWSFSYSVVENCFFFSAVSATQRSQGQCSGSKMVLVGLELP